MFKVVLTIISKLIESLLAAFFTSFVIVPYLFELNLIKEALKIKNNSSLLGITALIILILILAWNDVHNFWKRYKNTYAITVSKFTSVDSLIAIILFTCFTTYFTNKEFAEISPQITNFLIFNGIVIALYLVHTFYWPFKKMSGRPSFSLEGNEISDEPIKYLEEDLLKRESFVEGIYKEIKQLNLLDSFVFGLYGSWGDGKTSVLNLLKHYLKKDAGFIVVNFDPWNFSDETAMLTAFFYALEKSLNRDYIFPNLKKLFAKYHKLITYGLSKSGIQLDFNLKEDTIEEIRERIEAYISSTNKKLVIIIDEIDRLEKEEIQLIFKLVRSNTKFRNSIFILSLDTEKIHGKIDESYKYLEKIVQKPLPLPKIDPYFIDRFVIYSVHPIPRYTISEIKNVKNNTSISTSGYIEKIDSNKITITDSLSDSKIAECFVYTQKDISEKFKIDDKIFVQGTRIDEGIDISVPDSQLNLFKLSKIDQLFERLLREGKTSPEQIAFFDKEFVNLYRNRISPLIKNFRDAKRFLNSLNSSLPAIAEEVSLFDFVVLEVIKVFNKELYDDIFENWWIYVNERFENDYLNNPFSFVFSSEEDKKKEAIQKHIDDFFAQDTQKDQVKINWIKILESLFPNLNRMRAVEYQDRTDKRIFTTSFARYFTLNVPNLELSDAYFKKELGVWKEQMSEQTIIDSLKKLRENEQIIEFLNKLRLVYLDDLTPKLVSILLKTISKNISIFSKKRYGDWDSEYDRLLMLVLRILNYKINKTKIQSEMLKLINNTSDLLFAVDLVLLSKKERQGDLFSIYDNVDNFALRKSLSKRLERHFKEKGKNVISEYKVGKGWIRILYQWSSNWNDDPSPNIIKVTSYILSLFKNDPKGLVEFIRTFNSGFPNESWSMNVKELEKVYDLKRIFNLAKSLLKTHKVNQNEKDILTKFIKTYESVKSSPSGDFS